MTTVASPLDLAPEPMLPRPFTVVSSRRETADTVTLDFAATDGAGLVYSPGQFTMLYIFGVGEVPISVAGGTAGDNVLTHTVRAVGAVTDAICSLEPGSQVGIRGPYGIGWPVNTAEGGDVVIVAGGIGLAPLRPVVLRVLHNRDRYGAVSLLYGTRSPMDLLYEDELREWRSRFDIEVEVTVDRGADGWYGDVGLVTNLLGRIDYKPDEVTAMVCGPEIMMKVVAREMGRSGTDPSQVYVSMERNMKCAIGFCGHCQYGPDFICRDGPVFTYEAVRDRMRVSEL
ncbi:MAG: FAD/NAD(P)-binding protein [Acidimicrobiia bacterium]|nr:FAD/NAD(P)-binding protein [Acidimicrobiia bacterium]